jgi:predicted nucleic acid-binding protein
MKVIANSGPIIALAKLGLLSLLKELYGTVVIPSTVYHEVVVKGLQRGEEDAQDVNLAINLSHIKVEYIDESRISKEINKLPVHNGEKSVIELYLKMKADLALLNDKLARDSAKKLGVTVKGTLGVIIDAFRKKLLNENDVELLFKEILSRDDIWIAKGLVNRVWNEIRKELKK